ncbi:hypothetical protein H0H81_009882, partial [Sphagnurus paluster]
TQRVGERISFRQARERQKSGYIYGYPLNHEAIRKCGERLLPPTSDITTESEIFNHQIDQVQRVYMHLKSLLYQVRPRNKISLPEHGLFKVDDKTMWSTVLALVACEWPNEAYIPTDGELQEVRKILQEEGFSGDPGWFLCIES